LGGQVSSCPRDTVPAQLQQIYAFPKGATNVTKENRRREVTRAVWRQSYETWMNRPEPEREVGASAVNAVLAVLRRCNNEQQLHDRYWEPGDWPAPFLLRQLPDDPGLDELLTLEEAAFWLRYLEVTGQDR
jgi:hypothetical protein